MRKFLLFLIFGGTSLFLFQSCNEEQDTIQKDQVEVVMRRIGHEVLLSLNDSLSLVKPIVKEASSYRIQFGTNFSFLPDDVIQVIDSIIKKELPFETYLVKVEKCKTKEVVYSYEITQLTQFDEIACKTRAQPEGCYEVVIQFVQKKEENYGMIILIVFLTIVVCFGQFYYYKKRKVKVNNDAIKIGEYLYDAKKMLLIRKEKTIELTSKESELLNLLYKSANETVERDTILNKVWGDEGDYVGRTLDVYVSKLRKKLGNDASIQIKNIRGIGYKLIIED